MEYDKYEPIRKDLRKININNEQSIQEFTNSHYSKMMSYQPYYVKQDAVAYSLVLEEIEFRQLNHKVKECRKNLMESGDWRWN